MEILLYGLGLFSLILFVFVGFVFYFAIREYFRIRTRHFGSRDKYISNSEIEKRRREILNTLDELIRGIKSTKF